MSYIITLSYSCFLLLLCCSSDAVFLLLAVLLSGSAGFFSFCSALVCWLVSLFFFHYHCAINFCLRIFFLPQLFCCCTQSIPTISLLAGLPRVVPPRYNTINKKNDRALVCLSIPLTAAPVEVPFAWLVVVVAD